MKQLLTLAKVNAKAIVAFVATALVTTIGLDVPADVQVAVASLLVAGVTWITSNESQS